LCCVREDFHKPICRKRMGSVISRSIGRKAYIGHILDRGWKMSNPKIAIINCRLQERTDISWCKCKVIWWIQKIRYVEQNEQLGLVIPFMWKGCDWKIWNYIARLGDMIFKGGYIEFYNHYLKNGNTLVQLGCGSWRSHKIWNSRTWRKLHKESGRKNLHCQNPIWVSPVYILLNRQELSYQSLKKWSGKINVQVANTSSQMPYRKW